MLTIVYTQFNWHWTYLHRILTQHVTVLKASTICWGMVAYCMFRVHCRQGIFRTSVVAEGVIRQRFWGWSGARDEPVGYRRLFPEQK